MLIVVGMALMFWLGSVLVAYELGKRKDAREWARWYLGTRARDESDEQSVTIDWWDLPKCAECGNREIHQHGCSMAGPHDRTLWFPPPPAPPDDTDPGKRIKEGGWPPR